MITGILAAVVLPQLEPIQTWDRPVVTGVTYRMERIPALGINVHALKLDPAAIELLPALAGKDIFDDTKTNGRSTLTQLVKEFDAQGGINGDFFQFGNDPGGDPSGAFLDQGDLLSIPGSGGRADAIGWSAQNVLTQLDLKFKATVTLPTGVTLPLNDVNARVNPNEFTLNTPATKISYGPQPFTRVIVKAPTPNLPPRFAGNLTIISIENANDRSAINPGTWELCAGGEAARAVESLKPGDTLKLDLALTGLDPDKTPFVFGGGPELISNNKIQPFLLSDTFAETKHPRSAVGFNSNGEIWFLVVDGRQPESVGIRLADLAQLFQRYGCTEAFNLDGGGSSSINLFGHSLNRPSGRTERLIANGIVWRFKKPINMMGIAPPQLPESIPADQTTKIAENPALIYTCQGDAWIDQSGTIHPLKAGECTVTALFQGQSFSQTIKIVDPQKQSRKAGS
jgi:hypothetical protein